MIVPEISKLSDGFHKIVAWILRPATACVCVFVCVSLNQIQKLSLQIFFD